MIKFSKKNILISLICSVIIFTGSIFLSEFYKGKSNLISYYNNKKTIKISVFDKVSKKNTNQITLSENDPKDFILNRNINENTDVLFTYNKDSKKIIISTVDDEISINNEVKPSFGITIKEIEANIGDTLVFGNNNLEIKEDLKSVFKIKDFINGLELKRNIELENKENLLKDQNYSFEKGLWTKTVDLCEKLNDKESVFSQSLSNNCTDGYKCLIISSKNNTGCVSNFFPVELKKDNSYQIYFDYKQIAKESVSSVSFILFGSDGKNAYYTSDLSATDNFKTFSYSFNINQNVSGIIIKLNITGKNGKESSVIFDNFKIVRDSNNEIIEINKNNILKDYSFGKVSLKNDLNEFKATSKIDSEISYNDFDYFLTFNDINSNSSFVKKINTQETVIRLFNFFILMSTLTIILSSIFLLKNLIIKYFKIIIYKLLSFIKKSLAILINYPKNKISEIKKEKTLFTVLKILILIIVFGFYLYNSIINKKEINILSAFALFYGINSVLFIIESRISAFFAIIFLTLCPILLILKKDTAAENMAVQAYYFLVITVTTQIRENREENKK